MKFYRKVFSTVLALLLFTSISLGKINKNTQDNGYSVNAAIFTHSPKIDGKLEDPFWENAVVLERFTQYEPQEGTTPSEKTTAYIGHDRKNLYIAVRCFDSNPKAIRACLTQRDEVYGDDEVTIYLDTFNDKKIAFAFQVNPCGVQSDGIYTETRPRHRGRGGGRGGSTRIDRNWDAFFLSNAHMDEKGYTIELSIPFKSLRFPNADSQTWGLQIQRNIRRKNEEIYWYPRSRDINGFLPQMGQLHIEGELEKGKNLEVMPVITGLKESGKKFDPEPSLNLKYGITSNMTADLAFNPDFSQIEADMPQVDVNQRYALYYPEKRPFFLEGKDYFDTPLEMMYTRTIANPIWGAKLTGKIGKTTIGFLSAYDADPTDIDIYASEEEDDDDEDEPQASRGFVNIFRLKQDLFPESHIGIIFTDKEAGDSWDSITSNYNRAAGIDGHFKFKNYYRFSFQIAGSSSKVENDKTDLVPAMYFRLSHTSRHWNLSATYTHLPEEFDASSGFFRRKDLRQFQSRIGYNILPQNEFIVDIRPSLEYKRAYDFNGMLTDEEIQIGGFISGWRGSHIRGNYEVEMERYGGINFHKKSFRIGIRSEPFSWFEGDISFSAGDGIYYDDNPYLGYKVTFGLRATFKPLRNLNAFYNLQNNSFYKKKGGDKEYRINILSQRISYQLSRTVSLRVITDYNDYDKELYNSVLLSYEYGPGTVFYLGIDDNQAKNEAGIFQNQGRFYFIKFSYWWRI
jgi:hypothetical protein